MRKMSRGAAHIYLIIFLIVLGIFAVVFASNSSVLKSIQFPKASTTSAEPFVDLKGNGVDAPPVISAGSSITLNWSSTNTTNCTADGLWSGSKATSGSLVINNLQASGSFILSCTGLGGSTSDSVNITVDSSVITVEKCWEKSSLVSGKRYWSDACKGDPTLYTIAKGTATCSLGKRSTTPTLLAQYKFGTAELSSYSSWVAEGKPKTPCQQ